MRMSRLFGRTLREVPGDAETASHALLLRGGYIDQLMAGVYSYLPLGWRVERKVERIIREEMDAAGGQEVRLPVIQPIELWERTGRKQAMGDVLFQLIDRRERPLALGPTHEEVVTQLFDRHASSYRDLPVTLYQIQTKFRDEARPRGGLVRVREFTMKDAYSFDVDERGLDASYDAMFHAYRRIFARCGVPTVAVEADSGAIGGKGSQEFIFVTDTGDDTIVVCDACDYAANTEKAEFVRPPAAAEEPLPLEPVATPGITTIEDLARFLGIDPARTAKAVLFVAKAKDGAPEHPVFAVVRGDLAVNEVKLVNALGGREIRPMLDAEVAEHGLVAGYASPIDAPRHVHVIADLSIPASPNLVAGANRVGEHLRNVNHGRDWSAATVADIALARDEHRCPRCEGGTLRTARGIEMGHVFRLGTTYTKPMEARVLAADGKPVTPVMGCYGIGLGRIVAAAVEAHHDEQGVAWPASIAPYDVHLVGLALDRDAAVREDAERLYAELTEAGLEVLYDDREESPGVKFNDADLLGMPLRLTVSSRNLKGGAVELQRRAGGAAETVARADAVARVRALREEMMGALI
ncbi:MAG: proline--tRNA ligase [Chloroflexi bacterium]|nr:proline--tRNA ligase [Chloroflexota bacterium]